MSPKIFRLLSGLAIVLLLIDGCKKSSDLKPGVDLNGVFLPSTSLDLSAVQMYTINGQVNNQDIIKSFIINHKISDNFIVGTQSIPYPTSDLKINFKNNTSATTNNPYTYNNVNSDSSKYTIKQKSNSGFILEAVDTINALENGNDRLGVLIQNANKINGFGNCIALPSTTQYDGFYSCSYRNIIPFVMKNGDVYMSFLALGIVSNNGLYQSNEFVSTTGIFNPDITKQLTDRDTLIVQSKLLLFTMQ